MVLTELKFARCTVPLMAQLSQLHGLMAGSAQLSSMDYTTRPRPPPKGNSMGDMGTAPHVGMTGSTKYSARGAVHELHDSAGGMQAATSLTKLMGGCGH